MRNQRSETLNIHVNLARLKKAGGLGGAQPPPFANTMLALWA